MSIFKELRRRSKASFRTTTSTESQSNGHTASDQSSSTIGTIESSTTPPSSIKPSLSSPNLSTLNEAVNGSAVPPVPSPLPQRPVPITSQSNRQSYYVYAPHSFYSRVLLYRILTMNSYDCSQPMARPPIALFEHPLQPLHMPHASFLYQTIHGYSLGPAPF